MISLLKGILSRRKGEWTIQEILALALVVIVVLLVILAFLGKIPIWGAQVTQPAEELVLNKTLP